MHDLMSNLEKFDEPNPSKEQRRLLMKKVNDDEDIYINEENYSTSKKNV